MFKTSKIGGTDQGPYGNINQTTTTTTKTTTTTTTHHPIVPYLYWSKTKYCGSVRLRRLRNVMDI